jgi:hypothetical protein
VSSIGPRINADVKEVVAEALEEGVGSLAALDQQDPVKLGWQFTIASLGLVLIPSLPIFFRKT